MDNSIPSRELRRFKCKRLLPLYTQRVLSAHYKHVETTVQTADDVYNVFDEPWDDPNLTHWERVERPEQCRKDARE